MSPETCEALAAELGLPDFDLLLVGDGSGTSLPFACGWAVTSYQRSSQQAQLIYGGASTGTNNLAELTPYLHALWTFEANRGRQPPVDEQGMFIANAIRVAIVSDSEITVKCGNRQYGRNANGCLWAGIEWFEKNGYRFHWRHVPRNSNELSTEADRVAGKVRRLISNFEV